MPLTINAEELKLPLKIDIDIAIILINVSILNKDYLKSQLPRNYSSYITLDNLQRAINYYINYTIIEAPYTLCSRLNKYMLEIGKKGPLPRYIRDYLFHVHPRWKWQEAIYVNATSIEEWLAHNMNNYIDTNVEYILILINIPWLKRPRVYYVSNQNRSYIGFIAFGGNYPIYFIDLSTIPKPYPEPEYALSNYGIGVNFNNTKPIWDIKSEFELIEILKNYISNFVNYIVVSDYVSLPNYSENYHLNIAILNYRDPENKSPLTININYLKKMLYSLVPYTNWSIDITTINGSQYPKILQVINNSTTINNWIVLEYKDLISALVKEGFLNYTYGWNYTYVPCIIVIAEKPLYLTYKLELNFTAIATPNGIVVSYPGYAHRVIRDGIERIIAHEMGHMLGLVHPFEKVIDNETEIKWLYDWIVSPMSYSPLLLGWKGGIFVFDSNKLCIMHWFSIAKKLEAMNKFKNCTYHEVREYYYESYKYLTKGKCVPFYNSIGAITYIIKAYKLALMTKCKNRNIVKTIINEEYTSTPSIQSTSTHKKSSIQEIFSLSFYIIFILIIICITLYIIIKGFKF